jgi:hypothetical protein
MLIFLAILFLSVYFEPKNAGYFSKFALSVELSGCLAILAISSTKLFDNKFVLRISSFVFTIYLTHFLIFPINRIFGDVWILEFVKPIVILLLNYYLLNIGLWIFRKIKMESIYEICLGIRL